MKIVAIIITIIICLLLCYAIEELTNEIKRTTRGYDLDTKPKKGKKK